jgi:hypothetical protein
MMKKAKSYDVKGFRELINKFKSEFKNIRNIPLEIDDGDKTAIWLKLEIPINNTPEFICDCMYELIELTRCKVCNFLKGDSK